MTAVFVFMCRYKPIQDFILYFYSFVLVAFLVTIITKVISPISLLFPWGVVANIKL